MMGVVVVWALLSIGMFGMVYVMNRIASTIYNIARRMIKEVLLTLILFNCFNFAYSAGIHFSYASKDDPNYTLGSIAAVMSIVFPFAMILGLAFSEEEGFGEYKDKLKPGAVEKGYFVVTFLYRVGVGYYIASQNTDELSTLLVMGISIAFLVYNLVNLPYTKAYHNYRALHYSLHFIIVA